MVTKNKKISFKYYWDKKKKYSKDGKHPLGLRISFNRQSVFLPSLIGENIYQYYHRDMIMTDSFFHIEKTANEQIENIESGKSNRFKNLEIELERLIRFEYNLIKNKYSFSGFIYRLENIYSLPLEILAYKKIENIVNQFQSVPSGIRESLMEYYSDKEINFFHLLDVVNVFEGEEITQHFYDYLTANYLLEMYFPMRTIDENHIIFPSVSDWIIDQKEKFREDILNKKSKINSYLSHYTKLKEYRYSIEKSKLYIHTIDQQILALIKENIKENHRKA